MTQQLSSPQSMPKPSLQVEQALLVMGVRFRDFQQAVDNVIFIQAKEIEQLKQQNTALQTSQEKLSQNI